MAPGGSVRLELRFCLGLFLSCLGSLEVYFQLKFFVRLGKLLSHAEKRFLVNQCKLGALRLDLLNVLVDVLGLLNRLLLQLRDKLQVGVAFAETRGLARELTILVQALVVLSNPNVHRSAVDLELGELVVTHFEVFLELLR